MKILLFVTSIYNTLDLDNIIEYESLIDNLENIRNNNGDDIVLISFCDETFNKNVMLMHARKLLNFMNDKNIYFGEQFLGDVHYNNIGSCAITYEEGNFNKVSQIGKYVKELRDYNNQIELIIVDGNDENNNYEGLCNELDCKYSIINDSHNLYEINSYLNNLYNNFVYKLGNS